MVVESLLQLHDSARAQRKKRKRSRVSNRQTVASTPPQVPAISRAGADSVLPARVVAAGQGSGAGGSASKVTGRGLEPLDPRDTDAVDETIEKREEAGELNSNSAKRLKAICRSLCEWETQGLLLMQTPSDDPGGVSTGSEVCLLGWSKLLVTQPQTLNHRCRDMVEEDRGGIWKKANGKNKQALKNPTWCVYDLFRKIGAKPRFRGPVEGDPGKNDMFYYKEWEFKNDDSFKNARRRLAKGFSLCPDKGGRKRKHEPKNVAEDQPNVQV
jgi:hypothetical protein